MHRLLLAILMGGPMVPAFAAPLGLHQAAVPERPWATLLTDAQAGVLLKVRVLALPKGYAVEFRNDGMAAMTFNFLLRGIQNRVQGQGNGIISLEPGNESGAVLVSTPGNAAGVVPVDLFLIRLGHEVQGQFWRE